MSEAAAPPGARAQITGLTFAVLLLDAEATIREANPFAEDLFGVSARRLIGQKITDVVQFQEQPVIERLGRADAQFTARGLTIRVGDREPTVNLTLSPLASHPGWRVMTLSDASQGERLGEEDRQVGLRGPAILAHEIKNPLAAIRGAGQLIARKLDKKDHQLTDLIAGEVERIASLIDRMQRLGREQPEPVAPLNLYEAIHRATDVVAAAGDKGVRLREEFDPSLPPVLANGEALVQVLINLISNARDACSNGSDPQIVIGTRFVSGTVLNVIRLGRPVKLPVEISVSDNGPGVDPALRDHIFEPFVTSKKNGQGLGLALVSKLIRDMNGRIVHERDEKGGWTHFRINLPVAK